MFCMLRIDWASPRGTKLVGGLYERSVGWWLWKGEGHSKFLCCPSGHFFFFSSFILFNDLHFCCPALRTESQRLSVGSRRNDERSVTSGSRVQYSTLRGSSGRAASTCAISALCQVSYLPCPCPDSAVWVRKVSCCPCCFISSLRGVGLRPLPLQHVWRTPWAAVVKLNALSAASSLCYCWR